MGANRFDTLTKTLTTPPTRRAAVRLLVGAALGGPLATTLPARLGVAPDLVAAKNKAKKRKKCPRATPRKCGKKCIGKYDCCVDDFQRLPQFKDYRHCGYCSNGSLFAYGDEACLKIDPDGCSVCNAMTFQCEPGNEGKSCGRPELCAICQGGICAPAGRPLCGAGMDPRCCEGVCTKDGCCVPPANPQDTTGGIACCSLDFCGDDPCCRWPEEHCCVYATNPTDPSTATSYCCAGHPQYTFGCCFGNCCPEGKACKGDCGGRCCADQPGCQNCTDPLPGRR